MQNRDDHPTGPPLPVTAEVGGEGGSFADAASPSSSNPPEVDRADVIDVTRVPEVRDSGGGSAPSAAEDFQKDPSED